MPSVIFLDIDGVLVTQFECRHSLRHPDDRAHLFSLAAVDALNWLIAKSGAFIVVSSTWRMGMKRVDLQELLARRGMVGKVLGKTDFLREADGICEVDRGYEIAAFQDHRWTDGRYVIIDDDNDMLADQLPYFVQTEFEKGLTMDHARKALEILTSRKAVA